MKAMLIILLTACAVLASVTATAAPIVAANSAYSVLLADEGDSAQLVNQVLLTGQFDGSSQNFVVGGQSFTLIEAQSDLGGGRHLVRVELSSDSDMSHAVLNGAGGFFYGLGFDGNSLDFLAPVYLDQAVVWFATTAGNYVNDHLASDYRSEYFSGAWSGNFAAPNEAFVVPGGEGLDIRRLNFDFYVSELPEPGSLALVTLALVGAGAGARRRRPR
ncbi:PEP-CTERM sorting domain-containing protein [Roseateles sp. DC23W]|uniref:PEP-CTERM sorting domain-containing protein n=1 Tax=Pelomonas dachongensis TaxID=3299029 RepID=A0ABW7ETT6_9BURK